MFNREIDPDKFIGLSPVPDMCPYMEQTDVLFIHEPPPSHSAYERGLPLFNNLALCAVHCIWERRTFEAPDTIDINRENTIIRFGANVGENVHVIPGKRIKRGT